MTFSVRALARALLLLPFFARGSDALAHPERHRERGKNLISLAHREVPDSLLDLSSKSLGCAYLLSAATLTFTPSQSLTRFTFAALVAMHIPVSFANAPLWLHKGDERKADCCHLALQAGVLLALTLTFRPCEAVPSHPSSCSHAQ